MPTPYTRYWPYMELFAPKTINILALLKRHNVTPAIYMTKVEIRLGQLPVGGEMARVGTFVGGAKIHTIPQNDGDRVPIILSYS